MQTKTPNKKTIFISLSIIIIIVSVITTIGLTYSQMTLNNLVNMVEETKGNISNTSYSYYARSKSIAKISDFNTNTKALDSNAGNTQSSNLELNYREIVSLNKNYLDSSNTDLNYMSYPRLKTLTKSNGGYKYFLTFQNTGGENNTNGINIYYTRSKDLKTWDKPQILFKGGGLEHTGWANYSSADSLVLQDGTIMVVVAKIAHNTYNYNAKQFNTTGIYVKYSKDNGETWTNEQKIYAGFIWEPSITQLSTGEIQVFFTNVAPVAYQNGYITNSTGNRFHANTSVQFQSTGSAMISSIDKGQTWSPNITGVNEYYETYYNKYKTNPYAAYRVAQQYVRTDTDKGGSGSVGDFTYSKFYTSNGLRSHFGIKYDNRLIKMTDQMPVAIELNNKKKMVMALESVKVYMDTVAGQTEKTTQVSHAISLAYSNATDVNINGKNTQKYWIDIRKNTTTATFNSEKDVYNNEGLGLTEEGPVNRVSNIVSGAAPYITQFPSGETLLYYGSGGYAKLIIGNENGEFSPNKAFAPYKKDTPIFSSISRLSSHSTAIVSTPKESDPREISILPLYLNHTIDVQNEGLSSTNDEALFIGSDSQAQATIRTTYDDNKIYFTIDRLDNYLTDGDLIGLYINSKNLKYNGQSYDYLHFNFNHKKIGIVELVKGNTKLNVKGITYELVTVNNSKDNNGGYKVILTVPRATFNLTDSTLKLCAILNNIDDKGTTINDMMTNTKIEDRNTWIRLNLIKKTTTTTQKSQNNKLKDLSLSNGTLSPSFNANTTNYTATVNSAEVTIKATKGDNYQTVTGSGTKKLQYGTNTFKIVVTSQSGSKNTYTINITRSTNNSVSNGDVNVKSSNNYLKNINITPGNILFNKETLEYKLNVDNNITQLSVNASAEDPKANVQIDNPILNVGTNIVTINVTAENGKTRTYAIYVNRLDSEEKDYNNSTKEKSNNNYLKSINIIPGKILFDKKTMEYKLSVDNNITQLSINATAEDPKANIYLYNPRLNVGNNIVNVNVTAENGKTRTYTINVKRLELEETKSNNNTIKSLTISKHKIEFQPDVQEYDLTIDSEEETIDIDVILDDSDASYLIEGNKELKDGSTIKIKTLSESGLENEYIINIKSPNKKHSTKPTISVIPIIIFSTIIGAILIIVIAYIRYKKNTTKNLV